MANNESPTPVQNVILLGMAQQEGLPDTLDLSGALYGSGNGLFYSLDGADATALIAEA